MAMQGEVNILVVDDLPERLQAIQLVLEELGQNVVCVRSGREALRQLLEQDFAVILLDVNMPDMDGFETASLIRRRKRSQHTPIIFMTAFGDELHSARGYSLGAVDYLLLPFVPEVLRTKVRVFVDLFRMNEQVKRQAEQRIALAREQAARAAAEEATRRSQFLAEAGKVLVQSLDYEATVRALALLPIPFLADYSAVLVVRDQPGNGQTVSAWADPASGQCVPGPADSDGLEQVGLAEAVRRVLASGKPEHLPAISPAAAGPEPGGPPASNAEPGRPVTAPAARSAVILPLQAGGRTAGALVLAMTHSGRQYGPAELALAEDLAGRAAMALDNARLYRDIQEDDRRKNEFLAMLAHELRNPLAPIRNAVQILQLCPVDQPELQWVRDVIGRQLQLLVRMVDDLLDISRITRGKVTLQTEAVDVAEVVAQAVETSQPLLAERSHRLSVRTPPEPVAVQADPARLAQVLANLLNNAAKYTEPGGSIWLEAASSGGEVVFRVRDTGIGIAAEMLARVFEPFTQVERSLDRSQGGLGIGLTLVRRLVELHGGSVQAFSDGPGKGSEFVVRLPARPAAPGPTVRSNGAAGAEPSDASRRILVVDDNADAADSLAMLLRASGHEVQVAHDGPGALEVVRSFQPEVVLLDIGLPGMSGYEVARQIRQEPGLGPVTLVALTGYGQQEDRVRSRAAGFDQHLVKPVDPDTLPGILASLSAPQA